MGEHPAPPPARHAPRAWPTCLNLLLCGHTGYPQVSEVRRLWSLSVCEPLAMPSLLLFAPCCPAINLGGKAAFATGGSRAWWGECPHLSEELPESPPGLCHEEKEHRSLLTPWVLEVPSLPISYHPSGKFGAVCTCTERSTGLKLAAKVIKKQTPKDKVVGECRPYGEMFSEWTVLGWAPGVIVVLMMPHREKDGQTACYRSLMSPAINHIPHFSGNSLFWAPCAAQKHWERWL